ncbi:RidA family protein [Pseudonocardia lacus]|jgi:2-iminobutanoate/2-iminopropanoate deaminase|uniref:RidA family protein n=1 Tax=Pseudonocardia lacus TaxID=2835865 RepID=UPI001BDDA50D|nr:RidA family protein [Pseudonocardia lacus]
MSTLLRTPGQSPMLPGTVTAGGLVFTSGLIAPTAFAAMPTGAEVPAGQQITEVVELLRGTLADAGVDTSRVVKLNAYLSSAELFGAWNEAFRSVWPEPGPARTTLVAVFASPVVHIELEAIAAL